MDILCLFLALTGAFIKSYCRKQLVSNKWKLSLQSGNENVLLFLHSVFHAAFAFKYFLHLGNFWSIHFNSSLLRMWLYMHQLRYLVLASSLGFTCLPIICSMQYLCCWVGYYNWNCVWLHFQYGVEYCRTVIFSFRFFGPC